ncbi:hypothetical protein CSUI_009608, partial [Cystoisospora suis]
LYVRCAFPTGRAIIIQQSLCVRNALANSFSSLSTSLLSSSTHFSGKFRLFRQHLFFLLLLYLITSLFTSR